MYVDDLCATISPDYATQMTRYNADGYGKHIPPSTAIMSPNKQRHCRLLGKQHGDRRGFDLNPVTAGAVRNRTMRQYTSEYLG